MHHGTIAQVTESPVVLHFSFPRTGGHFLTHILNALYDTSPEVANTPAGVIWPTEEPAAVRGVRVEGEGEVRDRDNEINPLARYALSLRGNGGLLCPITLIHGRTGMHGPPGDVRPGERAFILHRDPISTVYSLYRILRDRWAPGEQFDAQSVRFHLQDYIRFYDAGQAEKARCVTQVLNLWYEQLVESPDALHRICNFIGRTPKLAPEFVWHMTKFENFTTPQARTFYREGRNGAWRSDHRFVEMLQESRDLDFRRFGYHSVSDYLDNDLHSLASALGTSAYQTLH